MVFEGGAERFFFKGEAGRWRGVLTDDDLALYESRPPTLDPTLRRWLEGGRLHARVGGASAGSIVDPRRVAIRLADRVEHAHGGETVGEGRRSRIVGARRGPR